MIRRKVLYFIKSNLVYICICGIEYSAEAIRYLYNFVKGNSKINTGKAIDNINNILIDIFSSQCMICLDNLSNYKNSKDKNKISCLTLKDRNVSISQNFKHLICPSCYVNCNFSNYKE